jgi:hypothetical protein
MKAVPMLDSPQYLERRARIEFAAAAAALAELAQRTSGPLHATEIERRFVAAEAAWRELQAAHHQAMAPLSHVPYWA